MTIIRTISRLILQNSSAASPRWLSTPAEESTAVAVAVGQPRKKNLLFHKVAKANSKSSVAEILNKWVGKGYEVKKSDFLLLSNYLRGRKNFQAALQLYDWMESSQLGLSNADQAIRIHLLRKTKGLASAEEYFNSLQISQKTSKTYGALLCCYCEEKVSDKALELFEEMKALNHMSTLNYNSMLKFYYNVEQPDKVVSLVQEMEEKNIDLDLYTYNLLINTYAASKNLDAIEGVMEKMNTNNVACDLFTNGNLATIYFNSGLHQKANAFLGMMEKMVNQSDKKQIFEACSTLIKLYSEMNNLSGVKRAWECLKSAFPIPNNTSYLFMLLALSRLGDQENLEKVFMEWEAGCSIYDFRIPNVLLQYYLSRNMVEEATSVYERSASKGSEPNLKTLSSFASLCVKNGQIDSALKYLETGLVKAKAGNHKWFPDDETLKMFLNYFEEKNDADRAEKFIQSMKKVNRLDSNSLLLLHSKASDAGS